MHSVVYISAKGTYFAVDADKDICRVAWIHRANCTHETMGVGGILSNFALKIATEDSRSDLVITIHVRIHREFNLVDLIVLKGLLVCVKKGGFVLKKNKHLN